MVVVVVVVMMMMMMMMVYLGDKSAGGGEDEASNEQIEIRRGQEIEWHGVLSRSCYLARVAHAATGRREFQCRGVWKLRLSEPRPVTGKARWHDASASLARAFTGG